MRVVSGSTGGSVFGVNSFSTTFPSTSTTPITGGGPVTITGLTIGNTTLDINQIPSHAHPVNAGGSFYVAATPGPTPAFTGSLAVAPGTATGNTGGGGSHTHPAAYTSATSSFSSSLDLRVKYIDVIICSKD